MIRKELYEGRIHWAVPTVLLISNTYISGSLGETMYPSEFVEYSAPFWGGRPLTLQHPVKGGQYVSANSPDILQQSQVGVVFNTRFISGRLLGEAWVDVERARQLDERLVLAIQQGKQIEVSTGLFTDLVQGPDGRNIAKNCYQPDHLAILLDSIGACSLKSGCGLNRT